MHTFVSARGSVSEISTEIHCAPIVHESIVFNTLELALRRFCERYSKNTK